MTAVRKRLSLPLFLAIVFLSEACTPKSPRLPVEGEPLVRLLTDIHVAETALQNVQGSAKDSLSEVYYRDIRTIHRLDQKTIDSTLAQLRKDPAKMASVYAQVVDRVANRK